MEASAAEHGDVAAAKYYCPQCGARYAGPGVCVNGHGAAEVVALDAEAAAETGDAAATTVLDPATAVKGDGAAADAGTDTPQPADAGTTAAIIAGIRDNLAHLEAHLGIGGGSA